MDQDIVPKSQMPPLHHKRMLAFVNHFIISSTAFLSTFVTNCEARFIELERKLQKVETALTIVEAKLASIPDKESAASTSNPTSQTVGSTASEGFAIVQTPPESTAIAVDASEPSEPAVRDGVRACDDIRYTKFFKMMQFGVPAAAVKIKMRAEGIDADILDAPNAMVAEDEIS